MSRRDRTDQGRRGASEGYKDRNKKAGLPGHEDEHDETGTVEQEARRMAGSVRVEPGQRIDDKTMVKLADAAFDFCMKATGIPLFPYQQEFGRRIVRSIFLEDSAEITGLFSRQGGKTETLAVIAAGLMVLLPVLARQVPDERLYKFRNGIHIGCFGPSYNIVSIICQRLQDRLWSKQMIEVMQDDEIGIDVEKENKKTLSLPNGSRFEAHSTNPRVPIEGHTYHLCFIDETQDVPDWRIRKSIHPMMAQTAGTIVKIGTPTPHKCEFFEACQRNKRNDLNRKRADMRQHFEFDYRECAKWSPRYAKYVEQEKERMGEESDDFRMSYRLHWILERGQYLTPEQLGECALNEKTTLRFKGKRRTHLFTRSNNVVTFDSANPHVAGIDIGRSSDSTVVTVGKVFWDYPIQVGEREMFYIHVANWLELHGDDHESQYGQILSFLKNYKLTNVMIDATGRGDPVFDRLNADLQPYDIECEPFIFTQQSKHDGFKLLEQEIKHHRITWPAGHNVRRYAKYRRFTQQFEDLEKDWRGKYMVVQAPARSGKRLKDAHDDYPDSLMLMLMATQGRSIRREVEVQENPFFNNKRGRDRYAGARKMFNDRAWWRG